MCTSFTYYNDDFYFGRNLDLDCSFGEEVVLTPRNFSFPFRREKPLSSHYALLGMATVIDHIPLYADAINEKGLGMAGLQFTGNAHYFPYQEGKKNITSFEIIPWVLGQCASAKEARLLLDDLSILDTPFSSQVPNSPLHWILADKEDCFVIESTKDGLHIYDDSIGVLTNNPPFPFHQWNLTRYINVTKEYPDNRFSDHLSIKPYANGMGAIGLPGDASSPSRFIHTAFLKQNLVSDGTEKDNVQQFFRVLDQVAMIKGSVMTDHQTLDYTVYSSCANATKGIYSYATYENRNITSISMHEHDLNQKDIIEFPLNKG